MELTHSFRIRAAGKKESFSLNRAERIPEDFLAENRCYELILVGSNKVPDDSIVAVNGKACDRVIRSGETVFPFETAFNAGAFSIAAIAGGRVLASAIVNVDACRAKLVREEYAAMIAEISEATLALYRAGGATVPAATNAAGQRSDVVTLDLVACNIDAFERAALRIADSPRRLLQSALTKRSILNANRLDDGAIERALRSPAARTATHLENLSAPKLVAALKGQWIPDVVERMGKERLDAYENRAISGFMRWLEQSPFIPARILRR